MGGTRGAYTVLVGRPEGKNHLKNLGVDGRIILKWNFKKWDGEYGWIDLTQDRDRSWVTCECRNELPGSVKCGEFLD
jgi:hypothetical protein